MNTDKKINKSDTIPDGYIRGRNKSLTDIQLQAKQAKTEKLRLKTETALELKIYTHNKNVAFYTSAYQLYCNCGFDEMRKITGYKYSKPNFVMQCSKYVATFIPQNGKRRG